VTATSSRSTPLGPRRGGARRGEWIEFESGENFKATGTEGFIVAQFMVGMNYYGIYEASPDGDPP